MFELYFILYRGTNERVFRYFFHLEHYGADGNGKFRFA